MNVRALAESIILQSLEDLATSDHRAESIRFFQGEGFRISAKIAGLSCREEESILALSGLLTTAGKRKGPGKSAAIGGLH